MNEQKLQEIENSYINGQKKQMVNQIKAYGVKRFMVDYYDYLKDAGGYSSDHYDIAIGKGLYSVIVYTFFLLNS